MRTKRLGRQFLFTLFCIGSFLIPSFAMTPSASAAGGPCSAPTNLSVTCFQNISVPHGGAIRIHLAAATFSNGVNASCGFRIRGQNYNTPYTDLVWYSVNESKIIFWNTLGATYQFKINMWCDDSNSVNAQVYYYVQ